MALSPKYGTDIPDAYAVFAGDNYYPGGGWYDFRDAFDTLSEARTFAAKITTEGDDTPYYWKHDWAHVVNLTNLSRLASFNSEGEIV